MALKPFSHGLVVGKFYPPHRGHHAIIRQAAEKAEDVTVVVMASAQDSISLADRVVWLRREHAERDSVHVVGIRCDAPLGSGDQRVWATQVASIRAALSRGRSEDQGEPPIDAVFCGDTYGPELAARLGAVHMKIDRDPISASDVRESPLRQWNGLSDATKAGLAVRVVVVGAEATGVTTVAKQLWEHYRDLGGLWQRTGWVADYRREHSDAKWRDLCETARVMGQTAPARSEIEWTARDFDAVAMEQIRREGVAADGGSPVLVCDNDAFATWVWKRRVLGSAVAGERPVWARRPQLPRRDLYLISDHREVPRPPSVPTGGKDQRAVMTNLYIRELTAAGHSWILLTGTVDQRLELATKTIEPLIAARLRMTEPLRDGASSMIPS